ncbi:MAG: CTP synthase [Candidatus Cloacimonas sp.]|nr:CTP synthase [Candidatus Cloacimonadota bacterium]
MAKHIFVIGGVVSSLGKGIAASSIGLLPKKMNYKVGMLKLDPYLNVDPGRMSPFQHGEVFVTDDGAETDLDLGHYERFIGESLTKDSNATAGKIYERVLQREKNGEYDGKTVQVIPHVTNEIKHTIQKLDDRYDIVITEIGGTVGDIESLPFLEAIRQFRMEVGIKNSLFVFLTYVPYIRAAGELKTKPTQHSAYKLREIGIQPDILICRSEKPFGDEIAQKISLFTNVPRDHVFNANNVDCIYEVPVNFWKEKMHQPICQHLELEQCEIDLSDWEALAHSVMNPEREVNIALCGKYVEHQDAYKSVWQALIHSSTVFLAKLNLKMIDTEKINTPELIERELEGMDGILIPGGFGSRGIDGKIEVAKYARENKIPFFGICLGLQIATIEFIRNVGGLLQAYSTEFDPNTPDPVIDLIAANKNKGRSNGAMRLGAYPCQIEKGTLAEKIYQSNEISERHRHRYEFNNEYRELLTSKGMTVSGTYSNGSLVEIVEIPDHPFYIAVQFHPEFKSRPDFPHPIFTHFIEASLNNSTSKQSQK